MKIENLESIENSENDKNLTKAFKMMQKLIESLKKRELSEEVIKDINENVKSINLFSGSKKELTKMIKKSYYKLLSFIEKEVKLVAKFHYRKLWMIYGLLAGSVLSSFSNVFEFFGPGSSIGLGIGFGMLIGIIIGTKLDQQAEKEGRQLDVEI